MLHWHDHFATYYHTMISGVLAAGDCETLIKLEPLPLAIAMGTCVAAGLAHLLDSLQIEDDVAEGGFLGRLDR